MVAILQAQPLNKDDAIYRNPILDKFIWIEHSTSTSIKTRVFLNGKVISTASLDFEDGFVCSGGTANIPVDQEFLAGPMGSFWFLKADVKFSKATDNDLVGNIVIGAYGLVGLMLPTYIDEEAWQLWENLIDNQTIFCSSTDGAISEVDPRQCLESGRAPITKTQARAMLDDPEGLYQFGLKMGPAAERWPFHCRAAHFGHLKARNRVGDFYRFGYPPVSVDYVQAYLWYSLARGTKTTSTYRDSIVEFMTSDQIVYAERLIADWKPDPEKCEELPYWIKR